MEEEIPYLLLGRFTPDGVVVEDEKAIEELKLRGYGDEEPAGLRLKDYEAIFLVYNERMKITEDGKEVTAQGLVDFALSRDADAWTRFLIYRDLRSRGYVVREGFGFGVDFRVYDRGEYGSKSAKYVVWGLNEGTKTTVDELGRMVGQMMKMGKEAVLAVIERRGEVIYYKIGRWRANVRLAVKAKSLG
ncbi:MAG: tRNA-intron lyase [Candidatus Bathyarchaeia archaeon]